jgi:hypothetical protein
VSKKKGAKKPKPTKEEVLRRHHLPTGGEFPFEPDKNWRPTEKLNRGPGNGFMDSRRREWRPGRSITPGQHFEWDVQLPNGDHINVDWQGNITHGGS